MERDGFHLKEPGCWFHRDAEILAGVSIDEGTIIDKGAIIGKPTTKDLRKHFFGLKGNELRETKLGSNVTVEARAIIYWGCQIASEVEVKSSCSIGEDTQIGEATKIKYSAFIGKRVHVGRNCQIGGFLCNDSVVGDNSQFFGSAIHDRVAVHSIRGAPIIGRSVFVGWGSIIIGGVRIGDHSVMAAGAVLTKSAPSYSIVRGINQIERREAE